MIPLYELVGILGVVFSALSITYDTMKKRNFDFPKCVMLLVASFISASGIILVGVNSLYYFVYGEPYPGQTMQGLKIPLLVGGLLTIIFSLYSFLTAIRKKWR